MRPLRYDQEAIVDDRPAGQGGGSVAMGVPLWVSSIRARPVAFVALLVLSALAVIVATLTPMLGTVVAATGLRESVAALRPPDDGVAVTAEAFTPDLIATAQNQAAVTLGAAASTGARLWTDQMIATATTSPAKWLGLGGSTPQRLAPLSIDTGGCPGIRIQEGRCPKKVSQAAVPLSLFRGGGYPLGSQIGWSIGASSDIVTVVGVYDDTSGQGALVANPSQLIGSPLPYRVHDLLLGAQGSEKFDPPLTVFGAVRIARPVHAADVPQLRAALKAAAATTLEENAATTSATLHTDLAAKLRGIDREQAAAATLTSPIALQALALAWLALAFVTQRMARARAVEWGIGRTRGLRRSTWLAALFVEPVLAIAIGSAAGYPIAYGIATATSRLELGPSTGVALFGQGALAAAALAFAGSLVALLTASVRSAALPLDVLLRAVTEPRRLSRIGFAVQVAVVLVTAVVIWSILTSGSVGGPQLALALPLLLALCVGTLAVRVTILIVRRTVRRRPRSLIGVIVGRGLARAPSAMTAAVLLVVAGALAAYAVQLDLVAQRAQTDRADLAVGAATVLTVSTPERSSLLQIVRTADPSGRVALAAEETDPQGLEGTDWLLAVDSARVAAVSTWRSAWRGGLDLRALRPASRAPLELVGKQLSVSIANLANSPDGFVLPSHPLRLDVVLATTDGWITEHVGGLRNGVLSTAIPCTGGCRLVSFELSDPGSTFAAPWGAQFKIDSLSTDTQSASALSPWLTANRWRNRLIDSDDPTQSVRFTVQTLPGLLLSAVDKNGGQTAEVEPAVGPAELPAVIGRSTTVQAFAGLQHVVFGSDLGRRPTLLKVLGRAPALPRTLTNGVLVDLGELERVSDESAVSATKEVWLTPGTQAAVRASLLKQGVRILHTSTATGERETASRSTIARSLGLAVVTAAGAVLLALLALVAAWIVDAPARRAEWRALRLAGCRPRTLRRVALLRFVLPAAVAALLGAPSAALAFLIAFDRLPLIVGQSAGPPIDATPPVLVLAILTGGIILAVVLIGSIGSRIEDRGGLR